MGRIAGFDGLRALAAGAVVVTHLGLLEGIAGSPLMPMVEGFQAVHLFFALSGFLITALLIRERTEHGRVSIRYFYARRGFRILPLYFFCVAVVAVCHIVFGDVTNGRSLIHSLTYTYNFMPREYFRGSLGHTWSLAVEEHFYLLWPVALGLLYPMRKRGLLLGSVFVCLAALFVQSLLGFYWRKTYVLSYWSCFAGMTILMGGILAMLSCDEDYRARAVPVLRSQAALAVCLLLWGNSFFPWIQFGPLPVYLRGFSCALFVAWIYHNQTAGIVRLLEWRPLRYLGTISYGIYMYQGLLLASRQPQWVVVTALCIVAPLSYHFFERPLIARGNRYRQRTSKDVVDATGNAEVSVDACVPAGVDRVGVGSPVVGL